MFRQAAPGYAVPDTPGLEDDAVESYYDAGKQALYLHLTCRYEDIADLAVQADMAQSELSPEARLH